MAKAETPGYNDLLEDPAGFVSLPMGCLDHEGYSMSNEIDFYTKFVVELVPNNVNDTSSDVTKLKPVQPIQPRNDTRIFDSGTRAINAPDCMNVMYSLHKYARGKVSHVEVVIVPNDEEAFEEAIVWADEKQVRPRLINFRFPSSPEKYLWIDMSWPIRKILLPISQASGPDERHPNCTYAQINFTQLQGAVSTDGWMEDGNQRGWTHWEGDDKRGLMWDRSAASMRVHLDLLYKLLTLPHHMRKDDYNALIALQFHRWDIGVPYNPRLPLNTSDILDDGQSVSNYPLTGGRTERSSTVGVAMDKFLSDIDIDGLKLDYPAPQLSTMVKILGAIVSTGLGLLPVISPLLAIGNELAFQAIGAWVIRDALTAKFGADLASAILESAKGYRSLGEDYDRQDLQSGADPADHGVHAVTVEPVMVVTKPVSFKLFLVSKALPSDYRLATVEAS